ncbi:MAG: hypothetical protein Q9222_001154 [Ikaeria aurantiellina]
MHREGLQELRKSRRLQKNGANTIVVPSVPSPATVISIDRPQKRRRSNPSHPTPKQDIEGERKAVSHVSAGLQHIEHWVEQHTWPEEYYQQGKSSMHHLRAEQKSTASLQRKRSEASLVSSAASTFSDQKPREEKSAPYRSTSYTILLETLGNSYMDDSDLGILKESKTLYYNLLASMYSIPKDTLFRDDVFATACRNLRDKNEARIILDLARLLAPSPESLAAFGAKHLDVLVESVNEGWNNCVPITSTRPQPDFAVGFRRSMFSDKQLAKLQPVLGDATCLSYFRATAYMYFPFLACEVKCGATGLDIADRQNAHSMTIAVRAIVELFKLAKREGELHRKILTFSISHDHRTVRLYGHYPVIDDTKTTKIYRHAIHTYDFTALDGKERWTTYKFVVAVYNQSLDLLKDIRSVVDGIPQQVFDEIRDSEFDVPKSVGSQQAAENVEATDDQAPLGQQLTPETSTQMGPPLSRKKARSKT